MSGTIRNLLAAGVAIALPAAAANAEIVIATAGPMTGQYAIFGDQMRRGAEQAVEDLDGGGVLGQTVVLEVRDDACDPKLAVAVANQLVNAGAVFVDGHFCSGSSIPASAVYHEEGILQISPASTNPQLTEQGFDNVFRVSGRDDQQGPVAADYVIDHDLGRRMAVVHDQTPYGRGLADAFKERLHARGVDEVLSEAITAGDRNFMALIDKMKRAGIDLIYFGGFHTEAGLILRQAHEQGLPARMVSGDALATDEFLAIGGPAGEGTLFTFGPDPRRNAAARDVLAEFREQGFEPQGYTLYAYAAIQVWALAVEAAGSTELADVIEQLRTRRFDTVLGTIEFDDKGDVEGASYVLCEWRDGEYAQIEAPAQEQHVRIEARAFVPGAFVWSRRGECEGGVVHRGDRRIDQDGHAVFTPGSGRFVVAQGVDVLSRRSGDEVVLQIDATEPEVKPTVEYALDALADGELNGKDNDGVQDDCHLLNRKAKASTRILEVYGEFRGRNVAIVNIRGGVRNPLLPRAWPRLDWDLEIEIDFSHDPPAYRVTGSHDGFPAYEVYVNDELAYGFDPGAPECQLRIGTPDGRLALPSYCAAQVRKLGGSLDVRIEPQEGPIALGD